MRHDHVTSTPPPQWQQQASRCCQVFAEPAARGGQQVSPSQTKSSYLGLVAQLCVIIGYCMSSSFIDFVVSFVLFYVGTGAVGMITIGEYILHRFLFHPHNGLCSYFVRKQGHACHNDAVPRMFINFVHHHVFLNDADRVVPHYTIYLCIIPAIMGILLCGGLPLKVVALIGGGLITGSLVSDCLHYSFHFGPSLDYQWYRDMKAAHHAHHYRDSNRDFGITTDLVDRCLGTKSPQTDNTALNRLQRGDLLWDVKSIEPVSVRNEAPRSLDCGYIIVPRYTDCRKFSRMSQQMLILTNELCASVRSTCASQ